MIAYLTFKALICFEFISVWMLSRAPDLFFCLYLFNFPNTIYEEIVFSLMFIIACFVKKKTNCICMGLFLGYLFCSIDLCVQYHVVLITVVL